MIHIPNRKKLSKEAILELIGETDILQYYIGPIKSGKALLSPFRQESNESFYVKVKDGHIWYSDLANSNYKGDIWRFLMQYHSVNFGEALEVVNRDFGLGLSEAPLKDYKRIIKALPVIKEKPPTIITPHLRPFTERELDYWKKHLQTEESLLKEHIYAIEGATINDKQVFIQEEELSFLYDFPEIDKKKLYFPEREPKHGKWYGTVPTSYVENIDVINHSNKIIICGSRKDRLCTQIYFPYCLNTQNESNAAFTPDFIDRLKDKEIYIFYDSDETGIRETEKLTKQYGFKALPLPLEWKHKDIAGLIYNEGPYLATQFFYNNKFI